MGEERDWADGLPIDLTTEIAVRLPCRADRGSMAAVCRPWRAGVVQAPRRPPALPWLLVPAGHSTRVHCVLSNCRPHHEIDAPPHGARFFGSHGGAWLFVAYEQIYRHAAVNLGDGSVIRFPDRVVDAGGTSHDMAMLAAALSAPPDHPNCIGACIYLRWPTAPSFAVWRMGSTRARDFSPGPQPGWPSPTDLEVEDVTFAGGDFFFLTRAEHIFMCQAPVDGDGHVQLILFEHKGRDYHELDVHSRYLVLTGLGLLMVVKFNNDQIMSATFRVFQMIGNPPQLNQHPNGDEEEEDEEHPNGDEEEDDEGESDVEDQGTGDVEDQSEEEVDPVWCPCSWAELDTLGGRMLFMGRGCSRSYEAALYPGMKAGIYFIDDLCFYDEEIVFRDVHERLYPCSDNGKWFEGPPPMSQRMPPQDPSSHSPPAWLLP